MINALLLADRVVASLKAVTQQQQALVLVSSSRHVRRFVGPWVKTSSQTHYSNLNLEKATKKSNAMAEKLVSMSGRESDQVTSIGHQSCKPLLNQAKIIGGSYISKK